MRHAKLDSGVRLCFYDIFLWILLRSLAAFFHFRRVSMAYMISSVSDKSNKFGMAHSPEYDMEAAVRLKSGAVGREHVDNRNFFSAVVGFCYGEQRMQNRGKKGFRTSQPDHQSFYPLQHRYTKVLSWPVIVLIGVLVALLVFGMYSPSTRSIASTASPSSRISHGQVEAAVHSRLDGGFQSRLPRFVKNNHSRFARAGMVFEQKVLDILQGIFWIDLHKNLVEQVGEQGSGDADNAQPPVDARNNNDTCKGLLACRRASWELVGGRRMLLQAQSKSKEEVFANNIRAKEMGIMHSNGKYLRGYAELGAELTKKKRMRKNKKKESEAPPDEKVDPPDLIFDILFEQFPLVADFVRENPFYVVYLQLLCTDATKTNFFYFCHEFPRLRDMVDWAPPFMFYLVYLRGTLGHRAFTVSLNCFLAFFVVLILILLFSPWRLFLRFLILLLRVRRRKRS